MGTTLSTTAATVNPYTSFLACAIYRIPINEAACTLGLLYMRLLGHPYPRICILEAACTLGHPYTRLPVQIDTSIQGYLYTGIHVHEDTCALGHNYMTLPVHWDTRTCGHLYTAQIAVATSLYVST